jgi:DNA polymerase-4
VGIAPIKMVAKIASDAAKPDGLLEVESSRLREFLDPLPVGRIWGVGPVARARLECAGLRTVGDLARADEGQLHRLLGDWGDHIARLARGVDFREVEPYREPVSISEENTFASDVSSREALEAAILAHAEAVARRLRRSGYSARTVVLKLKLARRVGPGPRGYPLLTRRTTLDEPTDDGAVISGEAKRLLAREELREPVRLLGVGVTNLGSAAPAQLALFGAGRERRRRSRLNRALDEIADRFGPKAVARGGSAEVSRAGLSSQIKRGEEE